MSQPITTQVSSPCYDEIVRIPTTFTTVLLNREGHISALLAIETLPLLVYPSGTAPLLVSECLTDTEVCWTVNNLLRSPVPPQDWLNTLEQELVNRVDLGAYPASLRHPTVLNLYLPLWAITAWRTLRDAVEQRACWKVVDQWLRTQGTRGVDVEEARELMGRMPWGMTIWAINESSSSIGLLAELLSTEWLRERHLDACGAYLTSRTEVQVGGWWIGEVYLATLIQNLPKELPTGQITDNSSSLAVYQQRITTGGYKRLLLPANVGGNHWVVFHVDIEKQEFCFGAPSHLFSCGYTHTYHSLTHSRRLVP
jgi:hypothetical protein